MKTTQSKYAEMRHVSRQRVSQWVRDGIIILDHGKVDVDRADADLERNLDYSKRIDYEARIDNPSTTLGENPPAPFTGTLRDWVVMGLTAFYPFFIEEITPVLLKLFKHLRCEDKSRKGLATLFAFKMSDLINDFIQKDIFKTWFHDQIGEDLDKVSKQILPGRGKVRTARPGKLILEHPSVILKLLKEMGPGWLNNDDKRQKKGR